jgi:chromosome segregation ATPase
MLVIACVGAAAIGFLTAWRWSVARAEQVEQSLDLRLKLRERDLRLAEERLRRLEAERWRPAATNAAAALTEPVEVDAEGLPKRPLPAAVQAEMLGLEHRCESQRAELELLRRDLAARSAELANLRSQVDALGRRLESGEQGGPGR